MLLASCAAVYSWECADESAGLNRAANEREDLLPNADYFPNAKHFPNAGYFRMPGVDGEFVLGLLASVAACCREASENILFAR